MKKLTLLLCALTLVFACNKNEDKLEPDHSNNEVSFTDGGIKFTRVTDNQFDSGDEVKVRSLVGSSVLNEAAYTYANGRFTSTSPFTIVEGQYFAYQAIYPSYVDFLGTHEIAEDQSEIESYEMSDLLVANIGATNEARPSLTFSHVMSSIVLNIYVLDEGQTVSAPSVDVTFNLQTAADVDVNSDSYMGVGDVNSITPYSGVDVTGASSHNYSVIAAPQIVPANKAIADVVINGTEHFQLVRPTDLELLSGKQYIYTFRVDVTTRESSVEFDGEIDNWGEVDNDGSEELAPVCTLADFAQGKFPTSTDSWVITDETATTEDFEGLRNVLKSLMSSQRFISLSFPNLTEIPEEALTFFDGGVIPNKVLKSVTADVATIIGAEAFDNCRELVAVSFPKATTIESAVFAGCGLLLDVSLPEATTILSTAFWGCSGMTDLSLPKVTVIDMYAFAHCRSLSNLELATEAKLTTIDIQILLEATPENIDLVIGSENEGVDVNARTWNGYTFKSITQQ